MILRKSVTACAFYLCFAYGVLPSNATAQQPDATTSANEQDQIKVVLKHYEEAYNRRSLDELQAIWPKMSSDRKQYKKIEWHLKGDPGVVLEKMTLEPIDWQVTQNQASVRCKRLEVYVRIESRSESGPSDTRIETGQLSDPVPRSYRKVVKKDDVVTMSLEKQGDHWLIASLSENKK